MKMRFARMLLVLVLAMTLCMSSALAVQYVTFDDIPGDWNNYESAVKWLNADYVPTSEHVWVDTDLLKGGEVAPGVFEYIADPAYAYQNPGAIFAYVYIDVPGEILYVSAFEGNWSTNEYMLLNSVATDGMYVELCFPSFDKDGKLLNTDRIYLCEYEVDGEWYYECVTFYFRYDGEETRSFLPKTARGTSVKEQENAADAEETAEPVAVEPTPEPVEQPEPEPTQTPVAVEPENPTDGDSTIAIIGSADGPTSIFVAPPTEDAFGSFFENVFSGVIGGLEDAADSEPVGSSEPASLPDMPVQQETEEEVTEEAYEAPQEDSLTQPAEAAPAPQGESKMFGFFSGVLSGIGN